MPKRPGVVLPPMYSRQVRSMAAVPRVLGRHAIPLAGAIALLGVYMGASLYVEPRLHHVHAWFYPLISSTTSSSPATLISAIISSSMGSSLAKTPSTTTPGAVVCSGTGVGAEPRRRDMGRLVGSPSAAPGGVAHTRTLRSAPQLIGIVRCGRRRRSHWSLACTAAADLRGEVYVLYNVLLWGHPEAAVAVAFLLCSCLAASDRQWPLAAWLFGAAVAFQPFVLLRAGSRVLPRRGEAASRSIGAGGGTSGGTARRPTCAELGRLLDRSPSLSNRRFAPVVA